MSDSVDTLPKSLSDHPHRLPRAPVIVFLLLIAVAILGTFLFVSHYYPVVGGETDGVFYMMRSSAFFSVDPYHGPGYPWAIRIVRLLGVAPFPAAKLVSLISALLLLIAVYRLFATMSTPGEAAVATCVMALNPLFLTYCVAIMSDMLALALVFWVCAILLSHDGTRPSRLFLAGVLAGLAYLSRYLYLFLLIVPVLVIMFRIHDTQSHRGLIRRLWWFFTGFLVFTLPWFVFMIRETDNPLYNLNHLLVAMRMYVPKLDFNKLPKVDAYPGLYDVIASDPKKFLNSWFVDFRQLPRQLLELVPSLGVISAFGALAWVVRMNKRKMILLFVTVFYSLVICVVWLFDRLLLFFLPIIGSIIASALFLLPSWLPFKPGSQPPGSRRPGVPLRAIATTVALIVIALPVKQKVTAFYDRQPDEYKAASDWLKTVATTETSVLAAKPHIPYMGNARFIDFRYHDLQWVQIEKLRHVLSYANPDYLIYDERYGSVKFHNIDELLKPENQPLEEILTPVYVTYQPMKLVVYEYTGAEEERTAPVE